MVHVWLVGVAFWISGGGLRGVWWEFLFFNILFYFILFIFMSGAQPVAVDSRFCKT